MHILVPVYHANEVPLLIHAGADWLYTEWIPWWNGKSDKRVPPPTHSISALFAPSKLEELEGIVQGAHRANARLFLKLAASYYSAASHLDLLSLLDQALQTGVDGFIFSDWGVLPVLTKLERSVSLIAGPEVYLGNVQALRLLSAAGASHVVLTPRLSLAEMARVVASGPSQLNYGCLIFNGPFGHCFYDPGLCNTVHAGKNLCDWDLEWVVCTYMTEGPDLNYDQVCQLKETQYWHRQWLNPFSYFAAHMTDWRDSGCGLCALPFLTARSSISFLQVGGEHHEFPRRLRATALVRKAYNLAAQGAEPAQVRETFRASQPHGELCDLTYRCLYPDALVPPSASI